MTTPVTTLHFVVSLDFQVIKDPHNMVETIGYVTNAIERGLDKQGYIAKTVEPIHKEHKLNGVVEAALNHAMNNSTWMQSMALDPTIDQWSEEEVFQVLEDYICNELARA